MAAQLVVEEAVDHFAFRHALTRRAIYTDLLVRERRALHLTIAEVLERLYPDPETYLPVLAYHFYQAEAWDKALSYAQRAGERAVAQHALYAALEQFNRAITARQRLNVLPLPALHHARGQVHERLGEFDAARSDYTVALEAARNAGDRQAEWQSLLALGFLWSGKDFEMSGAHLQDALALAREIEDLPTLAHSLNRVGNWHANMEQPHLARQYHEEALAIFREQGDKSGLAATFDLLGMASYLIGDMPAGMGYYQQALPLLRQAGHQQALITCLAMYAARGANYLLDTVVSPPEPLATCVHDAEEAIRLARRIGWRSGEAYARVMWGFRLATGGEYARALALAGLSAQLAVDAEALNWQGLAHTLHGILFADLLDFPTARTHLEQALAIAQEFGGPEMRHTVVGFLAPIYVAQGELALAETLLQAEVPASDDPLLSESQRMVWYAQADLALARRQFHDVLNILERGLETAPHIAAGGIVPRLWRLHGEALLGLNRLTEAANILLAAQETAEAQGARPLLWRILISLSKVHLAARRRAEANAANEQASQIIEALAANLDDARLHDHFRSQALASIPELSTLTPLQKEKARFGGLTRREREVAKLVADGMSNRVIAETLFIGERTVESHVSNILNRLGFNSRAQIAAWAVEAGLVE
jgi:DNA-binding CsgD family transcriptional regulator/tetratricopeptide (TPR) repeat protein